MPQKYLVAELAAAVKGLLALTKVKITHNCKDFGDQRSREIQDIADENCIIADENSYAISSEDDDNYEPQI